MFGSDGVTNHVDCAMTGAEIVREYGEPWQDVERDVVDITVCMLHYLMLGTDPRQSRRTFEAVMREIYREFEEEYFGSGNEFIEEMGYAN